MRRPSNFTFPKQLKDRILFTIGVLIIYRIGVQIPTPGVNRSAVMEAFSQRGGGVFGLLNTFTGGALEQFSILALGIIPYITASIIFQLLQTGVPYLEQLKKEGESGRKKINQYTRYATVLLAIFQSYGLSKGFFNDESIISISYFSFIPFQFFTIMTLTAGSCILMWLGEQINDKGVGNGASLLIFAGIAAGIPQGTMNLWSIVQKGELSGGFALSLVLFMILIVAVIIFLETGQRRIPVQYSQRALSNKQASAQMSHLPLKLNFAGVIPPIFASSLLLFPSTIAQFTQAEWAQKLQESFSLTGSLFNILFVVLIIFLCFFYTEAVFNPKEMADNLKKNGGFIPGIRAGQNTSNYVKKVLDRLTVAGAIYLSIVCVMPNILIDQFKVPFYFGGTSLLILVGVALDTAQQIQSHLLTARYEGMVKGVRIKSRRVRF
ncbi:MAG: preprotein translocase subunit SecY [Bdellovibrionales bacterium]|nr:preprotein translocase subunit SecY [Bdellovibrionales bacterium]